MSLNFELSCTCDILDLKILYKFVENPRKHDFLGYISSMHKFLKWFKKNQQQRLFLEIDYT